ncbi:MAG: hypothetical protein AAGK97_07490, partial [Bacteroidota bacterium]
MKNANLFICALIFIACNPSQVAEKEKPMPTEIGHEEGTGQGKKRQAWMELIHQTANGEDWKQIEYETSKAKLEQKKLLSFQRGGNEDLAEGQLQGRWLERGSV